MKKIIDKWEPVGPNDIMSASEALMEMVRRTKDNNLGLPSAQALYIARGVIQDYYLSPCRSIEDRTAQSRVDDGEASLFIKEEDYADALENTGIGLIPLAIRLMDIGSSVLIPDPTVTTEKADKCHELVGLVMTTKFNDADCDGKWGWARVPYDTRERLLELTRETVGAWVWTFYSQRWDLPRDPPKLSGLALQDIPQRSEKREALIKPSEAVYAFAAYMSSYATPFRVGVGISATPLVEVVGQFLEAQGFSDPDNCFPSKFRSELQEFAESPEDTNPPEDNSFPHFDDPSAA